MEMTENGAQIWATPAGVQESLAALESSWSPSSQVLVSAPRSVDHQLLARPPQTISSTLVGTCLLTDLIFEGEPSPDRERT